MNGAKPETKRITFRLPPDLFAQVTQHVAMRRSRDAKYSLNDLCLEAMRAVTDQSAPLARYQDLLAAGRATLRNTFAENDLNLIMDSCNGLAIWYEIGEYRRTASQPGNIIALNVHDSIRLNQLDEKWHVEDGAALVKKIDSLDFPAQYALVDLIERFWDDCRSGNGVMAYL